MKKKEIIALVPIVVIIALVSIGITLLLVHCGNLAVMDAARSVNAIGIVIAVWAGGYFTLYKLNVFRDFKPRINITLDIKHRFIDIDTLHISVIATLYNSSRVHVQPNVIKMRPEIVVPGKSKDPTPLETPWEGRLVIEPGESHVEVFAFCVNADVRTVKITVIVEHSEGDGLKWDAINFYDITNLPKGEV